MNRALIPSYDLLGAPAPPWLAQVLMAATYPLEVVQAAHVGVVVARPRTNSERDMRLRKGGIAHKEDLRAVGKAYVATRAPAHRRAVHVVRLRVR